MNEFVLYPIVLCVCLRFGLSAQARFGRTTALGCHHDTDKRGFYCHGGLNASLWSSKDDEELSCYELQDCEFASAALIFSAQSLLEDLGFDLGQIDGLFGSTTMCSVWAFRKEYGVGGDACISEQLPAELSFVRSHVE